MAKKALHQPPTPRGVMSVEKFHKQVAKAKVQEKPTMTQTEHRKAVSKALNRSQAAASLRAALNRGYTRGSGIER